MNRRTLLYLIGGAALVLFLLFGVDWNFVIEKALEAFKGIIQILVMIAVIVFAWNMIKKGFR